jgi:TctA family transporter
MSVVYFVASELGIFSLKFGKNKFFAFGMVPFIGTTYTGKKITNKS